MVNLDETRSMTYCFVCKSLVTKILFTIYIPTLKSDSEKQLVVVIEVKL